MPEGFETPPEKLREAGKRFNKCATDIRNAIECVSASSDRFLDSTETSHGDRRILTPVADGWANAESEIQNVLALMHEVVDKTGEALVEIATRYEERG